MLRRILANAVQAILVLLMVGLLAFVLFQWGADPVDMLADEYTTIEDRQRIRTELGLDQNFIVRYGVFLNNALHGDFGNSLRSNEKIISMLLQRFPATFELVLVATLLSLGLGIPLGQYVGNKRKNGHETLVTRSILAITLLGISMPTFLLGLISIFVFSIQFHWLPSSGRLGIVDLGFWQTSLLSIDGWRSIIMPASVLAFFQLGVYVRLVRDEVLEIKATDYIKFAHARGLSMRIINRHHILPNALLPILTIGLLNVGTMIAFSIVTESVFNWPGLGQMFIQAVMFGDFPVMAVYLIFTALIFVILNLSADIIYTLIDPRIRLGNSG